MKRILLLVSLAASSLVSAQTVLDRYVKQGIDSNLVLRQKAIALDQALLALKTARSYFQPSVNLSGGYTTGEGGRSIALPVGDLLNPVYSTLNQLTASNNFPQINNVEQSFFPNNLYDVHVRTTVPIINTDIWYGKSIRSQQVQLKEAEIQLYKRELVRDIKLAYFSYRSAQEGVRIYSEALELVNRNVKVNQSLLNNGKAVYAQLLRAQSEQAQAEAQLEQANNQLRNAVAYFNFLLNRKLDSAIDDTFSSTSALAQLNNTYDSTQVARREELKLLLLGERLALTASEMQRRYWVPKVNFFLDLGSQSEAWKFNSRSRYYLIGIQLEMPLYNGMRNRNTYRSNQLDVQSAGINYQQARRQLQLSVDVARNNLNAALARWKAAQTQQAAAQAYFRLIDNGYAEGVSTLLEFIDARNQLTAAAVNLNLSQYEVLQAQARLERETATATF